MRYCDASHVSVGSFYSGNPRWGKLYRFAGYGAIVAAFICQHDSKHLAIVAGVTFFLWLLAWYQVVGTLWRSSLVAALLLCAIELSAAQCTACGMHP